MIKVENLTVTYEENPVLLNVDLEIPEGVLMAIVGPNGAGKSTLIKSMLNLKKTVTGKTRFWNRPYREVIKNISYVPQRGTVDWDFPTNVSDVVMMGRYGRLGWFKRPKRDDYEKVKECIEKVGMTEFSSRQISQLSGGQQQRAFLARAIAQDADIYFMDEPFQGVDAKTEEAMIALLKQLRTEGKTVVVVHHDLQTVDKYFDYVTLLNKRVIDSGPVCDVFTTENIAKTYRIVN